MSGRKTDAFQSMKKISSKNTDINILILGETGVGKSTFINSFANYVQYQSLEVAEKSQLITVIPAKITISDENYVEQNIHIGDDKNEDKKFGNSSTQETRSYLFPLSDGDDRMIRLIDTPGIGDARGIAQDKENFENILAYLSRLEHIHAICFLLKPDLSVMNAYFKYCIMHLLSRLEKSASKNIIFFFTNARCTFYKPGQTMTILKRILDEDIYNASGVRVPCSKENTFYMDNEAFKYLVALKNDIKIGEREKSEYLASWNQSYKAVSDCIKYIKGDKNTQGLKPHSVSGTLSVNEARRVIVDLAKPLTDIFDLIEDNIFVVNRHKTIVTSENISIKKLQKNLHVPVINLKEIKLDHPATVCTATKCSEVITIAGMNKYHYKTRCHPHCYLTQVPVEIIGAHELINCAAMGGTSTCKRCQCNFQTHMHVFYETETYEDKIVDNSVNSLILNSTDKIKIQEEIVIKLNKQSGEYREESKVIKTAMAKFALFLQENSISVYNDSYMEYLNYLINREKDLGTNGNQEILKRYTSMKKEYMLEKEILENARHEANSLTTGKIMLPEDVMKTVKQLYSLKHFGKKIESLYEHQNHGRKTEYDQTTEYIHPSSFRKPKKNVTTKSSTVNKLLETFKELNLQQEKFLEKNSKEFAGKNKSKGGDSDSDKHNNQSKQPNKSKNKNNTLNNAQNKNQNSNNFNRNQLQKPNKIYNQSDNVPNLFGKNPNQFGNQSNQFGNSPNQFSNQPNQFGNDPNQFGNNSNQFGNNPNQFGNNPNQFGNNPNQFGNNSNQYGNQPNQFGNQPNQFGNNAANQFSNQPNQFGNNPNQFGNQPNQFGNNPNQFGNNPNQFGNQPNQFGNQSGNNPNQFGNQPNQFGNQPNQFGNNPNQFGNNSNQFGNQPNQFGNNPNQFGNNPNQFGNNPNQFGNQTNQFGNNPNQFGNSPNQFGNNPNQFGNNPNQFGNNPNQYDNYSNQFRNNSNQFGNRPNRFRNNQYQKSRNEPNQCGNCSDPSTSNFRNNSNNPGQQRNNYRNNRHNNNSGNNSAPDRSNTRRNADTFKKHNVRKNTRSTRDDMQESDLDSNYSD